MFSKVITESDSFLDMPLSTQALYFHLSMQADDDGFVSPSRIMRMIGAQKDDLNVLITKQFVIPFENGVVVIRHWKTNNTIQNDRKKDTIYIKELSNLSEEENGVYKLETKCFQNVPVDKIRLDKIRLDKISTSELECSQNKELNKQIAEILSEFKQINSAINFGHKTNRKACQDLIEEHGFEQAMKITKFAIKVQGKPYMPVITTPYQLVQKMAQLKFNTQQQIEKSNQSSKVITI